MPKTKVCPHSKNFSDRNTEAYKCKGMPRPLVNHDLTQWVKNKKQPHKMVASWLTGENAYNKDFVSFDTQAMKELHNHDYMLCANCGEPLGEIKVYGVLFPDLIEAGVKDSSTSGTAMHAKCALLAYNYCPHLLEQPTPFFQYSGEGHGIDFNELDELQEQFPEAEYVKNGYYDISEIRINGNIKLLTAEELKQLAKEEKELENQQK